MRRTLDGISEDTLTGRVDPEANTIAWLVWHIARIQDDHVAGVAGQKQAGQPTVGRPLRPSVPARGDRLRPVAPGRRAGAHQCDLLLGYLDAVHERTCAFVSTITDEDLDRVVDEGSDPPVTMAVRLVSVIADNLQHAGQAAYVRGVLER